MHLEFDETTNRTARVPHMQKWVRRRPSDMGPHLHQSYEQVKGLLAIASETSFYNGAVSVAQGLRGQTWPRIICADERYGYREQEEMQITLGLLGAICSWKKYFRAYTRSR